jgi:hypothetical protein
MNWRLAAILLGSSVLLFGCGHPDTREIQYGHFACGWGGPCDSSGPVDYSQAYGSPLPPGVAWPHSVLLP